jgi:hypothetical protein
MLKDKPISINKHQTVWENEWLKVKQTKGGFTYAERKGTNSVAFILYSKGSNEEQSCGVIQEWKDPIEKFITTAFGGSIDAPEFKNDLELLVKTEVQEESGYVVETEDIWYVGQVLVSTQMNQYCHLFVVRVDKGSQGPKTTENPTEKEAEVVWLAPNQLAKLEDWKAITAYSKAVQLGII